MTIVLEAKNLEKKFSDVLAVNKINFKVKEGEVFGFLGPNGAGKTTTMKMIQCVSPKTGGDLKVFGLDVNEHPKEIKQQMGVVPQMDNLDPDFSVIGNLIQYSRYFDIPVEEGKKRANELIDYFQLNEKKDSAVDKLSGGMKRRLVLARAMVNNPKLLILDEPTTGLDPQARHLIWEKLKDLSSKGITVIITTHYMEEAAYLCDEIVIMDKGNILAKGTLEKLLAEHNIGEIIEFSIKENPESFNFEKNGSVRELIWDPKIRKGKLIVNEIIGVIPHLLNFIHENNLHLTSFECRKMTLEDLFISLTGRKFID